MFDEEENKKKNILTKEEFALNQLKQDMKETEEHLIKIQKKIGRREKILPFEKRRNIKVIQDNKILRKELFANYLKLYLIKQNFKLKYLEDVVDHVKKQNLIFNSKINNINRMLNDLTNLNREMSENGKEMREIKIMIKEKLEKEGIICDIPEVIKLIVEFNRCKESNILSNENANIKENLIKEIMRFIFRYNEQFEKIIQSILVFNMKIKEKSISKNDLDKVLNLFNNKENINDIEKYSSTEHYSIVDYKSILKIIMQFFRKANYIYNNFIIDIAIEASNENEKEKEKEKEKERKIKEKLNKDKENEKNEENEKENEKKNKKIEIIIFSDIPKEQEEEKIEKEMLYKQKLITGKKLSNSQKKQELLKQNISKEINNMLDQGIDIEVLLERYLTDLRRKNDAKNKVVKKDKFQYETLKEKRRNDRKRREYEKVNKRIRERRLLFDKLKMKLFLDLTKYTSDLVKHDDWDKKNKTKYNIDIRLVNRKKNTKNVLSELLQEYNRNKVEKKFNKGMSEVFKSIVRKKQFEKKNYSSKKKKIEDIQILDNTFIDEEEYNRKPDVEIEKKKVKNEKNYFGYKTGLNKRNKSFKTMIDLQKISLELFYKKNKNDNYQNFNTIKNEFHKKLNMKIYSPIVSFFSPNKNLQKKNQLNTFSTSNLTESNINNNNNYIININHNRNFSFKNYNTIDYRTMSEKNLTLHKKKKYKTFKNKTIDKYPKISSGSITITN